MFRDELRHGAGAVVIAHNHPSGDAEPSRDDERITRSGPTVVRELEAHGTVVELTRVIDRNVLPGVTGDEGAGDEWPAIREAIGNADILIMASPTWLGRPSSIAQRVLERMDAMISETQENGLPVAYNKVAGVVVTGNEDGAHHVISEISGALIDIGFTVPGESWTYWNKGRGRESRTWTRTTDTSGPRRQAVPLPQFSWLSPRRLDPLRSRHPPTRRGEEQKECLRPSGAATISMVEEVHERSAAAVTSR